MGENTFMYHKEHGANLFKNAEPEGLEELEKQGWRDNPADAEKVDVKFMSAEEAKNIDFKSIDEILKEDSTEEGNEESEKSADSFPTEEPEETEPEEAPTETEEMAKEVPFVCGVLGCDYVGKSDKSVAQHRRMKHKVK